MVSDRKCFSAVVRSSRCIIDDDNDDDDDYDSAVECRYFYEPHVVVLRRDDNNEVRPVLIPVGAPIPVAQTSGGRRRPTSASTATTMSAAMKPSEQRPSERRRRPGVVALTVPGSRIPSANGQKPPASVTPMSLPTHVDARSITTLSQESSQTPAPSFVATIDLLLTTDKSRPTAALATVPDGGGIGLDTEVTRLISSVDSLHVPPARKVNAESSSKPKAKRSMQTILADLGLN